MSKKSNHIHRYHRRKQGNRGHQIYKCVVPGCTHYIDTKMADGRICECNRCGKPFVLDKRACKLAKPHCLECVRTNEAAKKIEDRLKALGM